MNPGVLSVSPLTMIDASPPEQVSAAAEAGFNSVELRVWSAPDEPAYPLLGDTPLARETLARLRDTGLRVWDFELIRLRPDAGSDEPLRILDAGARLGARSVSVVGDDPDEERLVDRFAAVCAAAAERGIRAGLEFFTYSEVPTIADALRIVTRATHPAGAVLVDPLHLQRSGGTVADVAALPVDRLPYLQLCDTPLQPVWPDPDLARTESRTARLLPGDGELPLLDLIALVPPGSALSVEGPVAGLAHLPAAERARRAFAALSRLLAEADVSVP